jgi:CRP/FNR family cyclic AMP-dependent transcriptional regulator
MKTRRKGQERQPGQGGQGEGWFGGSETTPGRGGQVLASGSKQGKSMNPSNKRNKQTASKKEAFNARAFLDSAGVARRVKEFQSAETIFLQGAPAGSIMYIQDGAVKITALSASGKEAIIATLGPGDFFGEGSLAGQTVRMGNATAIMPSTVLIVDKEEMQKVLHEQHDLSDLFIQFVLTRNIRIEEDLIDQLFNSTEKRLARTLLLLARYGKEDQQQRILPKVSQETLAEMIGTTRTRVNLFMNKFKKMGFIKYNGGLQINNSLLNVVLHD